VAPPASASSEVETGHQIPSAFADDLFMPKQSTYPEIGTSPIPPLATIPTDGSIFRVSDFLAPGEAAYTPDGVLLEGPAPDPASSELKSSYPPIPSISVSNSNGQQEPTTTSRRGQKVKGRPPPKKAASIQPEDTSHPNTPGTNGTQPKNRALSNTYPRKQPFKAQVEFPGYPPPNADIPAHYTMWDICQNMPNSLRENTLRVFVQREWSANELCACLKDDVRAVLNSRPGKDKTMVFQKRLERIKKDLVARGEFVALVNAPPLREDGRPAWVKRGNVRRR
jgi:hypothetical protein